MWQQVQTALHNSMVQVINRIAQLLPGVVALLLALFISAVVSWLLVGLLQRFLTSIQFDQRVIRWGFITAPDWSPHRRPTLLVNRIVVSIVMILGFLVGISAFDAQLTSQFVGHLFAYIPSVFTAAILLLVGNLIARFLARSVLISATNMNLQYGRLLSLGVKWLVLVLTVAMVLEHLAIASGIVQLAFGILFGGIVLSLSLAVGLGSKDLISRSLHNQSTTQPGQVEGFEDPLSHL